MLAGDTASFSVEILDDTCPLSYTWRRFGTTICPTLCTNSTLKIFEVNSNSVGTYSVVVSNLSGPVTSSNAYLTVVSGPYPASQSVEAGANVTFTILVNGFGPATYRWRFNGQDLPDANGPILSLTNVQPSQAGAYAVTVSKTNNPAGFVISPDSILMVQPISPRLGCVSVDTNGLRFMVWGSPDVTYVIQASDKLTEWIDISTNTAPASGNFEVIDPDAFSFDGRYYRALQP